MLCNVFKESHTMKSIARLSLTTLTLALQFTAAHAQELRSSLTDQREVAVTIYNEDLALVKDLRRVQLPAGSSTLAFRDVSARMRPETALLRSITVPTGLTVWEQNFDFDLLTPQKLLEKYVGQTVQVVRTQGGPPFANTMFLFHLFDSGDGLMDFAFEDIPASHFLRHPSLLFWGLFGRLFARRQDLFAVLERQA